MGQGSANPHRGSGRLRPHDAGGKSGHRGAGAPACDRVRAPWGLVCHRIILRLPWQRGVMFLDNYEEHRRPADLQVAVSIAYTYGWRMQSEVLTLERRQLDLKAGTLRLEPGTTKNDDGRRGLPHPRARALLAAQLERVRGPRAATRPHRPVLFPHSRQGRARPGSRVGTSARPGRRRAGRPGVPGRLRHDFRRTAVRNMVNARRARARRHEGHRAQDARRVRSLPHREPGDLQDARATARGHSFGHSRRRDRVDGRPVSL